MQDNCVLHTDMGVDVRIGRNVTIGHGAIIRGCIIGDNVMIGMNSTIMTHAEIGENSIVGANSFVPYNSKFPPRSMILGSPARLVRRLSEEDTKANLVATRMYRNLVDRYKAGEILGLNHADFK